MKIALMCFSTGALRQEQRVGDRTVALPGRDPPPRHLPLARGEAADERVGRPASAPAISVSTIFGSIHGARPTPRP